MRYLSSDEVLEIHNELVDFFRNDGDPIEPAGPRDIALLESACERPKTGLGGTDKYGTVDEKAAAFFHSLVSNHPFHNGNKRTALVSTIWFLDQNDRRAQAEDDEWFDFVVSVADGRVPGNNPAQGADAIVDQIRGWISQHTSVQNNQPVGMRTSEFLDSVEKSGGSFRDSKGGSWLVRGLGGSSIRISKSTRQLDGPAVRTYVQRLGLNEAQSGISLDEFQGGYAGRQDLIYELLTVLRQLAHT